MIRCKSCGIPGHSLNDCDHPVLCFNCNNAGHIGKECPIYPKFSGFNKEFYVRLLIYFNIFRSLLQLWIRGSLATTLSEFSENNNKTLL
jgi:hypothetical protein